jgi:hypothetical protein
MSAAARLYSPQQQQTCWHRPPLNGHGTVLVDEDLYPATAAPGTPHARICASHYKDTRFGVTFEESLSPVWPSLLPWRYSRGPCGHAGSHRGWTASNVHTEPASVPANTREMVMSTSQRCRQVALGGKRTMSTLITINHKAQAQTRQTTRKSEKTKHAHTKMEINENATKTNTN